MATSLRAGDQVILGRSRLQDLLDAILARGFQLLGPTVSDGAIIYAPVASVDDLPAGWTDEQEGGQYRLTRRGDDALFGYAVGPHSWKRFLHAPRVKPAAGTMSAGSLTMLRAPTAPAPTEAAPRFAFLGVRACELHAIAIQDRVLLEGACRDTHYGSRREGAFLVAVNCGKAAATCFCTSMGTGPEVGGGEDIALTEILENGEHYFVARAGTEEGASVLGELETAPAGAEALDRARAVPEGTRKQMTRTLDTGGIKELLYRNYENPRWDEVASRCLSCGNCTAVCPTCFCTTVEDGTDLQGGELDRERRWDSCFTTEFSYIHGGSVRTSVRSRYRQWMTHKLATWIDQFGTSGCVGCGRCITWCPVGIDITEEVRAIREKETSRGNQVA